jgi:hypothetical protein
MLQFAQSDSRIISSLCDCNYLSTEAVPFDITEIIPAESETEMIYLRRDEDKKNLNVAIFWDIAPCSTYVSRRFGGTHDLHLQGGKSAERQCAAGGSETSVYRRTIRRYIPEDYNIYNSNSTREICFHMFESLNFINFVHSLISFTVLGNGAREMVRHSERALV